MIDIEMYNKTRVTSCVLIKFKVSIFVLQLLLYIIYRSKRDQRQDNLIGS